MTLVKVTNDLLTASDAGLMDLWTSGAFDTINHHILLQRMEYQIVIRESALRWLDKVSHGVPQHKYWMSHSFLMLNSNKTEVIVLGPKHITDSLSSYIIWVALPWPSAPLLKTWVLSLTRSSL